MSNIFHNNINAVTAYNPNLASKLFNYSYIGNKIDLIKTEADEYNISYDSVPIHNNINAEKEAIGIFEASEDSPHYLHVIYGLGLGYLFKEFVEKSKGRIILYEPDLEVLYYTLQVVDFENELRKKNVCIVSDLDELEKIFLKIYSVDTKVKIHFLDYHKSRNSMEIQKLITELTRLNSIAAVNFNFEKNSNHQFFISTLEAFEKKIESIPFNLLENKCSGCPAIIVSAGPSLHKNIETLKAIQDKVIIFSVGTAYKTLIKNQIKPDFLNIIESYNCQEQISSCEVSDINFISEAYTNAVFQNYNYKNKFITFSKESVSNIWFAKMCNLSTDGFETKGTVSYNALNCAKILGCNPLILLGQDLAYTEGECYSKDSAYSELKCKINTDSNQPEIIPDNMEKFREALFKNKSNIPLEKQYQYIEYRLQTLNKSLTSVIGQNGELIPTEQGYALFIEYFKDFAKRNKDCVTLINSSVGGALIEGFETVPLDNLTDSFAKNKHYILEKINNITYKPDKNLIKNNISKQISICSELISILEEGKNHLRNFERELKKYKQMNAYSNKFLKLSLNQYIKIIKDYKPVYELVRAVLIYEESYLSTVIKNSSGKVDYETQMKVITALKNYFYNNADKLNFIRQRFTEIIKNLEQQS